MDEKPSFLFRLALFVFAITTIMLGAIVVWQYWVFHKSGTGDIKIILNRPGSEIGQQTPTESKAKSDMETDSAEIIIRKEEVSPYTAEMSSTLKEMNSSLKSINTQLEVLAKFVNRIEKEFLEARERAEQSGHEASTMASLRTLSSVQEQYRSRFCTYGTLANLSVASYIDSVLGSGHKSGYTFTVTNTVDTWSCTAVPTIVGTTGDRGFRIDQTGVIRYTPDGSAPTSSSTPLDD